jgi:hypothetical protein
MDRAQDSNDDYGETQEVSIDDDYAPSAPLVYTSRPPKDKPFLYASRAPGKTKEYTPSEHRENQVWTEALEGEEAERRELQLKKLSSRFRSTLRPVFHMLRLLVLVGLFTLMFWIGTLIVIINPSWKHGLSG